MSNCQACSTRIPSGSRFCPACGAPQPISAATSHGITIVGGSSVLADSKEEQNLQSSTGIDHGQFVPGTIVIERYRIVGRLGRGGMGEVYRADDLRLGTSVALKFLPRRLAKKVDRLDRFHAEVRLARQIAHPNVCRVYDIGEVDGQPFLSMEYVDGEDLSSLLRRIGRLPRDKAIEIARQLCSGLAAAHERGILHRDLKPANVMIDGRGHVRVTDFGLAALADDVSSENVRAGTPAYMSPEQLTSHEVSIRSDIYSLGLVLYEAFTGRKAFDANTLEDLRRAHAETAPPTPSSFLEDFDPAIERVILHCLEHDARERPASMLAVLAALPGGDPLAAAIAAGETPSPELVAAAAHTEGMNPIVCLACAIAILAGVMAFPFLNDQIKLHGFTPLEKSPEVLADRARTIIKGLRLVEPVDSDFGFSVNSAYLNSIEATDEKTSRWSVLTAGGPAAIDFWYRQSPIPMAATNNDGTVDEDDPPLTVPNMVYIRLDPRGALRELIVVPPARESRAESQPDYEWKTVFDWAELPMQPPRMNVVTPRWVPPVYTDNRVAWRGVYPNNPDVSLRVEAGSYGGRLVYFRADRDFIEPTYGGHREQSFGIVAAQTINVALFVAALLGASFMAQRNLQLNRGDRRGAIRISAFVAAAMIVSWLLQADHVASADAELALFARAAGRALFTASLCWLFYIALEPHLRRLWPDMLISWNRLLRGRFRDPLVGRDILIGGLFGIFGIVASALRFYGPGWFDNPPPQPAAVPMATLLGVRYDIAELLTITTNALFQPMVVLVVLLLLLVLLRQRWLALTVFYILVTWQMTRLTIQAGGNPYVNLAFYGLLVWALLLLLMRFGLLALMIALLYVLILNSYPITADPSAWYRESSWFGLSILLLLSLYGFFTALAGRPLLVPRPASAT